MRYISFMYKYFILFLQATEITNLNVIVDSIITLFLQLKTHFPHLPLK